MKKAEEAKHLGVVIDNNNLFEKQILTKMKPADSIFAIFTKTNNKKTKPGCLKVFKWLKWPYLDIYNQAWYPRPKKLLKNVGNLRERLRKLYLPSLEQRGRREITVSIQKRRKVNSNSTTKQFFTIRAATDRNKLPRELVNSKMINHK